MNRMMTRGRDVLLGVAASALAGAIPAQGQDVLTVNIPAGPLAEALEALAARSGRQLVYPSHLATGARVPALSGRMTAEQALRRLLDGSRLRILRLDARMIVLGGQESRTAERRTMAQAVPVRRPDAVSPAAIAVPDNVRSEVETEIVVTGSNIRGQRDTPSPVIEIDRAMIDQSGLGTIAEVLATLPQGFGGTGNEDSSVTGTDRTIGNSGYGSSANLRGLGSDATLTLVNGRRLAGSGSKGDFADISAVPLAAVERVEILTDGASALYGSDAVGGVVNLILKRGVTGFETRARIGSVTRGGMQDYQLSQLAGVRWTGGSLLAVYEYHRREALASSARAYAASADLRSFGGDDFRSIYAVPGTVARFDPAASAFVAAFAIPPGQDGTGLTATDFLPGGNRGNARQDTDILPGQSRHSAFLFVEHEIGDALRLFGEGRYGHRRFALRSPASLALMPVTAANSFFVSPTGAALDLIAYSFAGDLGPIRGSGTVESWSLAAGGSYSLGSDWAVALDATHAQEDTLSRFDNIVNTSALFEALGTTPDDPATPFSAARDGFFNPYGQGGSNNRAILDFIGNGFSRERIRSAVTSVNAKLDGTLAELPGGPLRAAFGATYRRERFDRAGETLYFGVTPAALTAVDADRSVWAAFGELAIPLVGEGNARPGIARLLVSAAVRHEQYPDFGGTTDPKLGLIWSPVRDLDLRLSWGTSFRAPALRETGDPLAISAAQLRNAAGGQTTVVYLTGGNPDLEPERATSLSVGAKFAPASLPGFRAELTYYRINFTDRIGQPAFEDFQRVLVESDYAPFVTAVNPAGDAADRARVEALIRSSASSVSQALPATAFAAIVDGRYVNTARSLVRGIDLLLSQRFTLGKGEGNVAVNAAWLLDVKRQVTPAAALVERVATIGNPSDIRLRGSASWSRDGFGATLSVNHVNGYRDDLSNPQRRIAAWTTFDAQLRYSFTGGLAGRETSVSLSAQNIFAKDPPFANNSFGIGYDPANADPTGRFVALQISRRW